MQQFNYPTQILFGEGALNAFAERIKQSAKNILIVTDKTLVKAGIVEQVIQALKKVNINTIIFDETHPNPLEEDVERGLKFYTKSECDALIGLGGGSPMDTAKVIRLLTTNPGPLAQYDDAIGGDQLVKNAMPALYAIPTTSGTGSEVGRSGVIILRATGKKTIFFHPKLMPDIAVLEPMLTSGLPPSITVATGIDAFTHCLEAYFVNTFNPLADGIAQEGIRLILKYLPRAYQNGMDLESRGAMQMAAVMGATAFQKGLGMTHSLAHPLSAHYNTHHGLANALLLPDALKFIESQPLGEAAKEKMIRIQNLFAESKRLKSSLSESTRSFIKDLGVTLGLRHHQIPADDLATLSADAFIDTCHVTNIIPVSEDNLLEVYKAAY